MDLTIICLVVFIVSMLTFFSGFGHGMVLMPVLAVFMPLHVAIAITAIVHFLNNLFKLSLLTQHVNKKVFIKFGVPAIMTAILGAICLKGLVLLNLDISYSIFDLNISTNILNIVFGILIILLATTEAFPGSILQFPAKNLALGGVISGFMGGLSGMQGAFRSAFLLKTDLNKNSFIATNAAIASVVDLTRIIIYAISFHVAITKQYNFMLFAIVVSSLIGTFISSIYLNKVSFSNIRFFIIVFLYIVGLLLILGLV